MPHRPDCVHQVVQQRPVFQVLSCEFAQIRGDFDVVVRQTLEHVIRPFRLDHLFQGRDVKPPRRNHRALSLFLQKHRQPQRYAGSHLWAERTVLRGLRMFKRGGSVTWFRNPNGKRRIHSGCRTVPPSRCKPWREKLGTMSRCSSSAKKWTSCGCAGKRGAGG